MKTAEIYSVPSQNSSGYLWKWRSSDNKKGSADGFEYYHDCLSDARIQGYEVNLPVAHGLTAPGGAGHNLR